MKSHIRLLICGIILLGSFNPLVAQDLTGTWVISNTVIKKTIDNNTSTQSYPANVRTDSYTLCPRKIIFSGDQVTFEYRDGSQEVGTYEIRDNKLIQKVPTMHREYKLKLNNNLLQLDYILNYVINGTQSAKEECAFYGYKE